MKQEAGNTARIEVFEYQEMLSKEEPFYLIIPKRILLRNYLLTLGRYFILSFLSFGFFAVPLLSAWIGLSIKFGKMLGHMKTMNYSPIKVLIPTVFVIILEIIICAFIRPPIIDFCLTAIKNITFFILT